MMEWMRTIRCEKSPLDITKPMHLRMESWTPSAFDEAVAEVQELLSSSSLSRASSFWPSRGLRIAASTSFPSTPSPRGQCLSARSPNKGATGLRRERGRDVKSQPEIGLGRRHEAAWLVDLRDGGARRAGRRRET